MNRRLLTMALCLFSSPLALALAGCGSSAAPTAADPGRARQTLDRTLDAWRDGRSVEAMRAASPAVVVSDFRWERGDALKKYQVEGEGTPSGAERVFNVKLWIADARSKETVEQVRYRVGTDPVRTVFRALF